ncbi:hypothetical protein ACHAP5_010392 [Fusarium lateritium]
MLNSSEGVNVQAFKQESTGDERRSSNSTSSPWSFEMSSQSTQAQDSSQESGHYSMMESIATNSSFEKPYISFSHPSGDSNGSAQGYDATPTEPVENYPFEPSQIMHSQPQVALFSQDVTQAVPTGRPNTYQKVITHTAGNQSLFFEPLFNHTDYYLATSGTRPMQQNAFVGPLEDMDSQDTNMAVPQEQLLGATETALPNLGPSSRIKPVVSEQNTEEIPTTSLRVHPNYRNHFNNLALSSSIKANGYPGFIQDAQIRNLFVPNWAVTSLNTEPDPGGLDDAFGDIFKRATGLLKKGEPVHHIVGSHPNIAALYDQEEFDKSCLLSQWAARMVHSVKRQGYDFTCFASMNVFWYVMRWMIYPSPDTYAAMPEWIRPTSNQLFTPHISMADFVLWPAFRDLVVQLPQLQERMAWLADMSMFIRCEWPYELEHALSRDPVSGNVILADLAKV